MTKGLQLVIAKGASNAVKLFATITRTLSTPRLLAHAFGIVARPDAPG